MRVSFHLPAQEVMGDCVVLTGPGIEVLRDPGDGCAVIGAGAAADFDALGVYVPVAGAGTWYAADGAITGGLIVSLSSVGLPYCPTDDPLGCTYSAGSCSARITRAGAMTGDLVEFELTAPCALPPIERAHPDGIVIDTLAVRGELVTFSTGDSGVSCP